jgi:hypothetical protein
MTKPTPQQVTRNRLIALVIVAAIVGIWLHDDPPRTGGEVRRHSDGLQRDQPGRPRRDRAGYQHRGKDRDADVHHQRAGRQLCVPWR